MGNIHVQQVKLATGHTAVRPSTISQEIAFFDADGNPITPGAKANVVAAVATANATDLATAQALANQLKTTVNLILTNLKSAGLMKSS